MKNHFAKFGHWLCYILLHFICVVVLESERVTTTATYTQMRVEIDISNGECGNEYSYHTTSLNWIKIVRMTTTTTTTIRFEKKSFLLSFCFLTSYMRLQFAIDWISVCECARVRVYSPLSTIEERITQRQKQSNITQTSLTIIFPFIFILWPVFFSFEGRTTTRKSEKIAPFTCVIIIYLRNALTSPKSMTNLPVLSAKNIKKIVWKKGRVGGRLRKRPNKYAIIVL